MGAESIPPSAGIQHCERSPAEYLAQKSLHRGQASSKGLDITADGFRDSILGEIVLEQVRRGDTSGARRTAESIAQTYARALTVAKAAGIRARAGDRASADAWIKWAIELAEEAGHKGFELTEI